MGKCMSKDQKQIHKIKKQYLPVVRENDEDSTYTESSVKSVQSSFNESSK